MPALVAPILAFVVAGVAILLIYRIVGRLRPGPGHERGFKAGQIISGGLLALAHGTNDAQKTMGIITLALIANGELDAGRRPAVLGRSSPRPPRSRSGTYMGGWRIIKTMGSRIIKMDTAQGFAAQGSGAAVILAATHVRLPALHHPHDLRRRSWAPARPSGSPRCAGAWPATSSSPGCSRCPPRPPIGGATYGVTRIFGTGLAGPLIVFVVLVDRGGRGLRAARPAGLRDHGGGGLSDRGRRSSTGARCSRWSGRSLLGGIGVTAIFAVAIFGAARAIDAAPATAAPSRPAATGC